MTERRGTQEALDETTRAQYLAVRRKGQPGPHALQALRMLRELHAQQNGEACVLCDPWDGDPSLTCSTSLVLQFSCSDEPAAVAALRQVERLHAGQAQGDHYVCDYCGHLAARGQDRADSWPCLSWAVASQLDDVVDAWVDNVLGQGRSRLDSLNTSRLLLGLPDAVPGC